MKNSILLFIFVFFSNLYSQKDSASCEKFLGLYNSLSDLKNGILTNKLCADKEINSIRIGTNNSIIIKENKKKKVYSHKNVFGFRDGFNNYRYFEMKGVFNDYGYFCILDTSYFVVYSMTHTTHTKYTHNKATNYYFSMNLDSEIMYLDKKNLKSVFSDAALINEISKMPNIYERTDSTFLINTLIRKHLSK